MREVVIRRFCANCYRHGRRTELAPGDSEYMIVVNEFGAKTDLCDGCAHSVLVPLLEMMSAGEDLSALSRQDWAQLGAVFPRTAAIRKLNGPTSIKPAASEPAAAGEPVAATQLAGGDTANGVEAAKAKPRKKATPRKKAAPGRSKAAADKSHVCQGCGQTFTRAANLALHVNHFGTGPHQRPARRGAALLADKAPQDKAPQDKAPHDAAPRDEAPHETAPRDEAPHDTAPRDEAPHDAAEERAPVPAQQAQTPASEEVASFSTHISAAV